VDLSESQEDRLIELQLRQAAVDELQSPEGLEEEDDEIDEEDGDDEDITALPTPKQPGSSSKKRKFGSDRSDLQNSSPVRTQMYNKRHRVDKGKDRELEIPSTPEDVIHPIKPAHQTYQSSPLKPPDEEEDEEDNLFVQPFRQPDFARPELKAHIVEPETQDFHFPPSDGDDAESFITLTSPHRKITSSGHAPDPGRNSREDSSTQSQTDYQREAADLQAYIDFYISMGYPQDIVIKALQATTMETGDAAVVMESLIKENCVPRNIQGVWTKEDDDALENVEGKEFDRILAKHGPKRVITRQRFMTDRQEARRELGKS